MLYGALQVCPLLSLLSCDKALSRQLEEQVGSTKTMPQTMQWIAGTDALAMSVAMEARFQGRTCILCGCGESGNARPFVQDRLNARPWGASTSKQMCIQTVGPILILQVHFDT